MLFRNSQEHEQAINGASSEHCHYKEVVTRHKHVYTTEELEIQTINMNKLSRESFQTQFTESK